MFKIGQTVILCDSSFPEINGTLGTVVESPRDTKYDEDRIWVEWHGEKIQKYISSKNTTCYTKVDIVRPYTKLDKALK